MEIEKTTQLLQGVIRNELNCTELILESKMLYQENYQIRMIRENNIENVLKVTVSGKDEGSQYIYDISGMKTMKRELERHVCDKIYIEKFLKILLKTVLQMNNYMLDINCILLNPEYIYVKGDHYYFCYYPAYTGNILESFHELAEFFVREIDYGDYESVILACGLHKETMEEQYELKSVIQQYANEALEVEPREEKYDEEDEEGIEEEVVSENVIRETAIKRFWGQKKKEKWGTWDDLLTCEESSIMGNNRT